MSFSRVGLASAFAAFLVVLAVGLGLGASRMLAKPTPTPPPAPTFTPFVFTPAPDTGPRVFQQPLSAGCATSDSVWVVSNGGGIGRFDGQKWSLIDPTLRSLVAAACSRDRMLAVGPVGRIVTADDRARSVSVDSYDIFDLLGVSSLSDGNLVVGSQGQVLRQDQSGWQPYAKGIEEDLYAVSALGPRSAFAVGAAGIAYRLEGVGWRQIKTGVAANLRAVVAVNAETAVAAGDDGTLLAWTGTWKKLESGTTATLRAATRIGSAIWIAGDQGTLLVSDPAGGDDSAATGMRPALRVDLRTTCTLRGVFARGNELWIVGSDGQRAAVWRRAGDAPDQLTRWGDC